MPSQLEKYLDFHVKLKKEEQIKLPLYHNCTFDQMVEFLDNNKIISDEKPCDVFEERIVYTFYGASKFISNDTLKTDTIGDKTSCIILNANVCVNIYKIYPLDSGAASGRVKGLKPPIEWEKIKEKLNLGYRIERVNKMVLHCFKNLADYVDGNYTKKDDKVEGKYPTPGSLTHFSDVHKFMLDINNRGDERRYCYEVLFKEEIELFPELVLGIICSDDMISDESLEGKLRRYRNSLKKGKFYPSSVEVDYEIGKVIKDLSIKYTKENYLNGRT